MLMKTPTAEVHKSFISTTPTLESLSYMLRNPDTWPPGFEWDYNHRPTCAMGLAVRTWSLSHYSMCNAFNMPPKPAFEIFSNVCESSSWFRGVRSNVTPVMVADAIDKYLATA